MLAFWPIVIAVSVALTAFVIGVGRRRRSLTLPLLGALVSLTLLWAAGEVLRQRGWRDVDGWVDCFPACRGWHLIGALTFWLPLISGLLLIVAVSAVSLSERDSKRRS